MRTPFMLHVLTTLALAAAPIARTQSQTISSGTFVVRLGNDTISVERFTRTRDRIEGDLVRRIPRASMWHYSIALRDDGSAERADLAPLTTNGDAVTAGVRAVRLIFGADSVTVETVRDTVARRMIAAHHAFLMLPESYAPYEAWFAAARAQHTDSVDVNIVAPLGGPQGRLSTRLVSNDSARVWVFGFPIRVRTDVDGRLLGLNGSATTLKYEVAREPYHEVVSVAKSFAARDASVGAVGTFVSGRDTVRAELPFASVWIDYGRPLARGRDVFRNGVLGDTLWRTGANAATQFRTDRDVRVGSSVLRAGLYSMWIRVSPDNARYELVFNSQAGQWGTEHHADRDVLSVPLAVVPGSATDQFTILVSPDAPALRFRWGTTELTARLQPPS